ncbi:hypothetical protein HOY80DRAFT_941429 [Tuber brumale]|nr:hypothetical protein HOY80DRAFT_941429 [Tuber brumale]
MEEPSKHHEDHEYLYIASRRGVDHRIDLKNKIRPRKGDFGITPVNGEQDAPVQSPYTASQLRNHSPTLTRIIPHPSNARGMAFSTCALRQGPSNNRLPAQKPRKTRVQRREKKRMG